MKRRKFLLGLGSTAAAGSAVLGSGAFSRVDAHRSVTIQVAEDPNAYLGLDKCQIDGSETPNSSYAHLDDLGHLKIYMDDENPTIGETPLGEGVNSDSTSWFHRVFQICNQGKEDVCLWIADDEDWPTVGSAADGVDGVESEDRRVEFYLGNDETQSIIGEDNAIGLPLGECVCIGIKTRTYGLGDGDELLGELDNEINIVADVGAECLSNPEPLTETGRISLAYEDLPEEDSDWDYNDWVVDIFGTYVGCGEGGSSGIKEFEWDIVPQVRGAGDTHRFEFDFDCSGEYTLTYYDDAGTQIGSDADVGFDGNSGTVDIEVWNDTSSVLDDLANSEGSCTAPGEWARLSVTFDDCCEIGTFSDTFGTHGTGLPFNPVLENHDESVEVEKGDPRLLVVPEEWEWPLERTHIADAYEGVGQHADDSPIFNSGWENTEIDEEVTQCNFEVQPDNSLS